MDILLLSILIYVESVYTFVFVLRNRTLFTRLAHDIGFQDFVQTMGVGAVNVY